MKSACKILNNLMNSLMLKIICWMSPIVEAKYPKLQKKTKVRYFKLIFCGPKKKLLV